MEEKKKGYFTCREIAEPSELLSGYDNACLLAKTSFPQCVLVTRKGKLR